jgi:hypothetical protein
MSKKRRPGKRRGRTRIIADRLPCGQPKDAEITATPELLARRAAIARHGDPVKSITPILAMNARGLLTDWETKACERYCSDYKLVWGAGFPKESSFSQKIRETSDIFDVTQDAYNRLKIAEPVVNAYNRSFFKRTVVDCIFPDWMVSDVQLSEVDLRNMNSLMQTAFDLSDLYAGRWSQKVVEVYKNVV